jgi:hypothetical protein
MYTRTGLAVLAAVLAAAALTAAPAALAEERTCRGAMGATTVVDLVVPQGATCTLKGTRVKGSVRVERGATLNALRIRVIGNVHAEGAVAVNIARSRVGESVQVVQGGKSKLSRTVVRGDVQYFENRGRISIRSNRVDGNLQCKENSPGPRGGGNVIQGDKEDQCSGL